MDTTNETWLITNLIKEMEEELKQETLDDWENGYNACAHRVLWLLGKIEENYN